MTDIDKFDLKKLLEHAHIGVVIHNWDTSIVYANPTAMRLLRLSHDQIIGKDAFDPQWRFVDESGRPILIDDYPVNRVKDSDSPLSNEVIGVRDSTLDHTSWFLINAYKEGEAQNSFIVITLNDISDSRQQFSFQQIVENTQDVVIVTEAGDTAYPTGPKIVYVNHAFEKLTGYSKEQTLGETPRMLQGALTDKESKARIHQALNAKQAVTETLLNYDIHGRPYWIEINIIPLKNRFDEVTHYAAIERDVSERKFHLEQLKKRNDDLKTLKQELENIVRQRSHELQLAKTRLEEIAFFDPLTNIPNRRYFTDIFTKLANTSQRRNLQLATGLLDIDDFKQINDQFGHEIGDGVLVSLASFFKSIFRNEDAFCRYGGEEFAFALLIDSTADLITICQRLLTGIRELRVPSGTEQDVSITASIGIHFGQFDEIAELRKEIKQADEALYKAKDEGKDRVIIFKGHEELLID